MDVGDCETVAPMSDDYNYTTSLEDQIAELTAEVARLTVKVEYRDVLLSRLTPARTTSTDLTARFLSLTVKDLTSPGYPYHLTD